MIYKKLIFTQLSLRLRIFTLLDFDIMTHSLNKHIWPVFPKGWASSQLCGKELPVSGMAVIGFKIQENGINANVGLVTS